MTSDATNTLAYDSDGAKLVMTILIVFFLIFFVFFVGFAVHIVKNIFRKGPQLLIHWIEYAVVIVLILTYIVLYIIQVRETLKLNANVDCSLSYLCKTLNINYYIIICVMISNSLFNIIQGVQLCLMINKIVAIEAKDVHQLTNKLNEIEVTKTTKTKRHLIEIAINFSMNASCAIFLGWSANKENIFRWKRVTIYSLCPLVVVYIFVEFFVIYLLKFYKKKILENNFYSSNLIMQAIYNVNVSKVVFFNEFVTYKAILDFVSVFPTIIFYVNGNISFLNLILLFFLYAIYVFFIGAMYLYVDKTNKIPIRKIPRKIFCLGAFNFNFGEKEKAKLFDEYLLDWNTDESRLLGDLNTSNINGAEHVVELETSSASKTMRGYLPVNFYLIFKFLSQFYEQNKESYSQLAKSESNDEIITVISMIKKKLRYPVKEFLNTKDDLNYANEFNTNYLTKQESNDRASRFEDPSLNNEFEFDAMFASKINKLFPRYKISIDDIIDALNPKSNYNLANTFWEKRSTDQNYNFFYTHNNLLIFEVYNYEEEDQFINKKKIDTFIDEYNKNLIEDIFNGNKKTFLPLMIGMFSLSYKDYKKLIVLYRNPIAFINKQQITANSSLISLSESDKQIIKIYNSNESTQISDTVKVENEKFNEILEILSRDFNLLNKISFVSFFKVNLFIITESERNDSNNRLSINDSQNDNDLFIDNSEDKIKHKIYQNGSTYLTEIERLVFTNSISNKYVIKLFISEMFRTTVDPSLKEMIVGAGDSNVTYAKYLRHLLIQNFSSEPSNMN